MTGGFGRPYASAHTPKVEGELPRVEKAAMLVQFGQLAFYHFVMVSS